ncbi:DNA adenine methylase, partial [Escherichia coli]
MGDAINSLINPIRSFRICYCRRCCMSTILKWAGNKTAIMSELKKHLPAGPRLVEPFAGS